MNFKIIEIPDADLTFSQTWRESESTLWMEQLKNEIQWQQHKIRLFGKWVDCPRLSAWYGDLGTEYTYSNLKLVPKPWSPTLLEIRNNLTKSVGNSFNSVLINLYRDGNDSMGWHSDDEPELGSNPVIASISFGSTRMMKFRHRTKPEMAKISLALSPGSLLVMRGTSQQFWQHQIPKTKKKLVSA
jgi:alkylated DNA repair dioxygenase AlkB